MKKMLFGLMMLFSSIAFADRTDALIKGPDMPFCGETARFFSSGVNGNADGYARKVSKIRPEHIEYLEHRLPLPHDSMWVMGAQDYSDKEFQFIADLAIKGWDELQKIKDKGVEITPDLKDKMVQTYFEGCMYDRTQQRVRPQGDKETDSGMHKVVDKGVGIAQNEAFAKKTESECNFIKFDLEIIDGAKTQGVDQAALEGFARNHSIEFEAGRIDRILRQIKEYYAWEGSYDEFLTKEMKGCD